MKQISLILFFILFAFSFASARLLPGSEMVKDIAMQIQEDDPSELMGLEVMKCDEEDEECVSRRITAEAHLDYIYTQGNKPQNKAKP